MFKYLKAKEHDAYILYSNGSEYVCVRESVHGHKCKMLIMNLVKAYMEVL